MFLQPVGPQRRPPRSAWLAGLLLGCAVALPLVAGELREATQSLYRVHYDGPAGQGGLRLVLRRASTTRFQLEASDLLGRALWTLRADGEETLLANHREKILCQGRERIEIPDPVLAELSPADLARALEGLLPVTPPDSLPKEGRVEFRDSRGRRWTASYDLGLPVSWTLWDEKRPVLWWLRAERGAVLSHRDGSQFRWRLTSSEPLAETGLDSALGEGYRAGTCEIGSAAGGSLDGADLTPSAAISSMDERA